MNYFAFENQMSMSSLYGVSNNIYCRLVSLTADVKRIKKPKLPKKRLLKKINRR